MNFIPADNYDSLLKQARAMANLINALEHTVSILKETNSRLSESRVMSLECAIESEKEMNAQLTNEIEVFEGCTYERDLTQTGM